MRDLKGSDKENCIFEWLLCLDLKGSIPKYVLNTVSIQLVVIISKFFPRLPVKNLTEFMFTVQKSRNPLEIESYN